VGFTFLIQKFTLFFLQIRYAEEGLAIVTPSLPVKQDKGSEYFLKKSCLYNTDCHDLLNQRDCFISKKSEQILSVFICEKIAKNHSCPKRTVNLLLIFKYSSLRRKDAVKTPGSGWKIL